MNSIERIMCLELAGGNGGDESGSLESVLVEISSVLSLCYPLPFLISSREGSLFIRGWEEMEGLEQPLKNVI